MTLMQIEEARTALAELTIDEAELTRLLGEQTSSIQVLKDGGSKDFTQLASLDAKRSALTTMLAEQRDRIVQHQDHLQKLEVSQILEERLLQAGRLAEQIHGARTNLDSGVLVFIERNIPHLLSLAAQLAEWGALRMEWARLANALDASVGKPENYEDLLDTLRLRGVDTTLLRANRQFSPLPFDVSDPWPVREQVVADGNVDLRFRMILQEAVFQGVAAKFRADHERAYLLSTGLEATNE